MGGLVHFHKPSAMNQLMNDGGVCKTAPATMGLLKKLVDMFFETVLRTEVV